MIRTISSAALVMATLAGWPIDTERSQAQGGWTSGYYFAVKAKSWETELRQGPFVTMADASMAANDWRRSGSQITWGPVYTPSGTGGGGAARQPATRTEYRSTAYERYIYQDRHGRRYWSGWRSAGSMQNVSRDSVQRQINGWIEGDIQRRRGLVSRKADPITTVQVRGNP